MKIKYRLERWHTTVLFQVLEMEEQYRNLDNYYYSPIFKSSNDIEIKSIGRPSIIHFANVYVRGQYKEDDFDVDFNCFDTESEAQAYLESIDQALTEWNNYVEIMEINYSNGRFKNDKYIIMIENANSTWDIITISNSIGYKIKQYYVSEDVNQGFPLDKTIIMFNRDCELLGIPFRLKEEK